MDLGENVGLLDGFWGKTRSPNRKRFILWGKTASIRVPTKGLLGQNPELLNDPLNGQIGMFTFVFD